MNALPKEPVPPVTRMSEPVRMDTSSRTLLRGQFRTAHGAQLRTIAGHSTEPSIPDPFGGLPRDRRQFGVTSSSPGKYVRNRLVSRVISVYPFTVAWAPM